MRRTSRAGVALASTVMLASACGTTEFSAAGAAGQGGAVAGTAGRAGAAGNGTGGTAISKGGGGGADADAGNSSSAGEGGTSDPPPCSCGAAQYCRAGACRECSDFSSFDFGTPEELLDHETDALRFPRAAPLPDALFFQRESPQGARLWYVPELGSTAPVQLEPSASGSRSGPLYAPGVDGEFNFFFDELGSDGLRTIRAATFDGEVRGASTAGEPLAAAGFDTYSVAIAASTRRAYWMSLRSGEPQLHTGVLGVSGDIAVDLRVSRSGGGDCVVRHDDLTPWMSDDGRLLLISMPAFDSTCSPSAGSGTKLFGVLMDPATGLPLRSAVILPVDGIPPEANESDASLSSDLCLLYFASDTESRGDFRLYRAARR